MYTIIIVKPQINRIPTTYVILRWAKVSGRCRGACVYYDFHQKTITLYTGLLDLSVFYFIGKKKLPFFFIENTTPWRQNNERPAPRATEQFKLIYNYYSVIPIVTPTALCNIIVSCRRIGVRFPIYLVYYDNMFTLSLRPSNPVIATRQYLNI